MEGMLKIVLWLSIVLIVMAGVLWGFEKLNQWRDTTRFPAPGDFVSLSKYELHRVCAGPASDITVWFEAGAGGSSLDWSAIMSETAMFARVCAYDRAGLGWSQRQPRPRDLRALLTDFNEVIQSDSHSENVVLVGHSFGGFIAEAFARQHPDRVAGLVLLDALDPSFFQSSADQARTQISIMRLGAALSAFGLPRLFGLAQAPPGTPAEIKPALISRAVRGDVLATIADEAAMMPENLNQFARLPDLPGEIPVTLISRRPAADGAVLDQAWHDAQDTLAARYLGATRVKSTSDNHYIQFEQPDLVIEQIRQLILPDSWE